MLFTYHMTILLGVIQVLWWHKVNSLVNSLWPVKWPSVRESNHDTGGLRVNPRLDPTKDCESGSYCLPAWHSVLGTQSWTCRLGHQWFPGVPPLLLTNPSGDDGSLYFHFLFLENCFKNEIIVDNSSIILDKHIILKQLKIRNAFKKSREGQVTALLLLSEIANLAEK